MRNRLFLAPAVLGVFLLAACSGCSRSTLSSADVSVNGTITLSAHSSGGIKGLQFTMMGEPSNTFKGEWVGLFGEFYEIEHKMLPEEWLAILGSVEHGLNCGGKTEQIGDSPTWMLESHLGGKKRSFQIADLNQFSDHSCSGSIISILRLRDHLLPFARPSARERSRLTLVFAWPDEEKSALQKGIALSDEVAHNLKQPQPCPDYVLASARCSAPVVCEALVALLDSSQESISGAACAALATIAKLPPNADRAVWKEWWLRQRE